MPRFAGSPRFRASIAVVLTVPLLAGASLVPRHIALKRSEPAGGSRLAKAPTRVSLWFTAKPQLAFTRIRLAGASGAIALDTIVADSAHGLHADIPRAIGPGDYRVEWQTASTDGHSLRGEFLFAVLPPSTATGGLVPVAPVDTATHAGHAGHPAATDASRDDSGSRTARWFEFVAILTVLGALGFRHGVLPPLAARGVPTADAADRARRLGLTVLALYAIAAAVRMYRQSIALNGPDASFGSSALWPVITETTWGIGWSVGAAGAALVLVGWYVSKRSSMIGTPMALSGALGMVLAAALSGHAAASRHFILSVTLDMLHVVAAGLWVGGLAMVLCAGIPAMLRLMDGNRHAAVSALVNSFHPLALFCAPIAVLSGVGSSWIRLGGLGGRWGTPYGQTLLVKIGFVVLLAAMGAYNSMRLRRRLGAVEERATRRFRLSGGAELLFAAAVLIVTTFLVVTPPPGEMVVP